MKIPASIREIYEEQKSKCDRLKEMVDVRIAGIKDERWHYESRVKSLQSFALKVESGRFRELQSLEDFFACTLVVANTSEIERAEQLIHASFFIKERRPPNKNRTHKRAESFPFDDLRLYISIPVTSALPTSDLTDLVFELQIKTFLQHAWSIATHDLVYKSDDVNWAKERIAYQTKAMLEHAEVSIQEAETLSQSTMLAKEDHHTEKIKSGIAMLRRQWLPGDLPTDIRRLALNIMSLMDGLRIDLSSLERILDEGRELRNGTHPLNLSPYATIVQYLLSAEKQKMQRLLTDDRQRHCVLIPREVEMPGDIDATLLRNAIFIRTPI